MDKMYDPLASVRRPARPFLPAAVTVDVDVFTGHVAVWSDLDRLTPDKTYPVARTLARPSHVFDPMVTGVLPLT